MSDGPSNRRELQREVEHRVDLEGRLAVQTKRRVESDAIFQMLIETIRDYAIFMLDVDGHVATWNAGAQRFKGYTADEIIGQHFSKFYSDEEIRAGKCEYELEVAEREGRFEDEGWRYRKDRSRFWANVVITAVRDRTGELVGFAKVTRDLTDRKKAEDERAALLAAEQANRTKDEFLAMLGHELRNPLAPIVTALQLIKLRGDTRSAKEHEVIERQVVHMMNLVDDLLDVSRIARGKIDLKKAPVDVRDSIAKAIEIASPLLEQRDHHFEVKTPGVPIVVDGDEARLTQVFTNLLTNAAKYTPPGGHVTVTVRQVGTCVTVAVADDGTGIESTLLPKVFDLFVQGRQDPDRPAGGLGLGLTLVRSLVKLHDGEIVARSDGPGRGSVFTVTLPVIDQPAVRLTTPLASSDLPRLQSRRILIVDDNEDARMLLAEILGTMGHDVRTVGDGPAAIELIGRFTPELAILDIGLPVMDGYELAGRLREMVRDSPLRLIAVTGYGQSNDIQRSRDAGFDRHLVKPVELRRLLDCITELTRATA